MEANIENILLFKTDIRTERDKMFISSVLRKYNIDKWTIDQDDIDCVLRIISPTLKLNDVINLVVGNGYHCEELT